MLFRNEKRDIKDFLPRVLVHIDGIDTDMVSSYVMDSVIQFIRDSKIPTEIVCLKLDACVDSYKLHIDDRILEVIAARFFSGSRQISGHKQWYYVDGDVLYIENIQVCNLADRVELELLVAPYRDSNKVPDVIYEEWVDAITALTLSKLYLMTDNNWYNPAAANNQASIYQQLVRQARFSRVTKHKAFNMRLSNMRRL